MGKNRKSRQSSDFKKPKQKPGKILKKTNVTDTTFASKAIVLQQQFVDTPTTTEASDNVSTEIVSGMTIAELVVKINHPNEPILASCLERLIYFVTKKPNLVFDAFAAIISAVRQVLNRTDLKVPTYKILWKVLVYLANIRSEVLLPHFTHFCSTLALGLINAQFRMQIVMLKAFMELAKSHPTLYGYSIEIFQCLTRFYCIDCVTGKADANLIKYATQSFPSLFAPFFRGGRPNIAPNDNFTEIKFNEDHAVVIRVRVEPNLSDFCVIGFGSSSETPIDSKEGLFVLADTVFFFSARLLKNTTLEDGPILTMITSSLKGIITATNYFTESSACPKGKVGPLLYELAVFDEFVFYLKNRKDFNCTDVLRKLDEIKVL